MKSASSAKKKVKVVQNQSNPVPTEIMADAILQISKAMKILSGSRLKRDALVVLIKDKSQIPKQTIEIVLNNLEQLESTWLK